MRLIIIIIIVILVLSYFSLDLRSIIESPQTKENFTYIVGLFKTYVWEPAKAVGSAMVDILTPLFNKQEES